jgi:hypothetical protein
MPFIAVAPTTRRFALVMLMFVTACAVGGDMGEPSPPIVRAHVEDAGVVGRVGVGGSSSLSSPYGININQLENDTTGRTILRYAHDAGIRWVRVDFNWYEIQPDHGGQLDLSTVDSTVARAHSLGMNVLGVLAYAPSWAMDADTLTVPSVGHRAAWADFVRRVVTHPSMEQVKYWAIWNEPNETRHFFRTNHPDPWEDYIMLVHHAAPEIHAAGGYVVAGEYAYSHSVRDSAAYPDLTRLLQSAGGCCIDVVGMHIYDTSPNIREAMYGLALSLEPTTTIGWQWDVWLTETDLGTPCGDPREAPALDSEAVRAAHLGQVLGDMNAAPPTSRWRKTFLWHLYEQCPGPERDPHRWRRHRGEQGRGILGDADYPRYAPGGEPRDIRVKEEWHQYRGSAGGISVVVEAPVSVARGTHVRATAELRRASSGPYHYTWYTSRCTSSKCHGWTPRNRGNGQDGSSSELVTADDAYVRLRVEIRMFEGADVLVAGEVLTRVETGAVGTSYPRPDPPRWEDDHDLLGGPAAARPRDSPKPRSDGFWASTPFGG